MKRVFGTVRAVDAEGNEVSEFIDTTTGSLGPHIITNAIAKVLAEHRRELSFNEGFHIQFEVETVEEV